ncbi:MAG: phosphoenolpyruvate--protein phosphotransferase [Lachnospiraceae bacterium]|nr:phosphoenolpyruvate--protein phosphotransferase [Lachnospiraceae bacterium]
MRVASGKRIVGGISIGRIRLYKPSVYEIRDEKIEDPVSEADRFEKARVKVQEQRHALYEKAVEEMGDESAAIFEAHEMILDDNDLITSCKEIIMEQKQSAEYAVQQCFDKKAKMFLDMEDPYFRARSEDVTDLKNAMLDALFGNDLPSSREKEPYILVAEDLSPSETVRLDKSMLLGLVTREGSLVSHTAILAGSLDIPAIIQCRDISDDWDGRLAVLDGYDSCIYIDPVQDLIDSLTLKQKEEQEKKAFLQELKGRPNTTADGCTVKVCANIGDPSETCSVLDNDAEGVGLFRSEFVYLNRRKEPSEEEQFEEYKRVVEAISPKSVIIRTCDIGADKTADHLYKGREENPALGFRGIRISLARKDFFKRQLRALLRASAYGNLGIMFPMITSLWEIRRSKEILEECRNELECEGKRVGRPALGIMIETPAAVLCADELAEEVDFFSIGTNDLTQYACAIDRQNAKLEPFFDPHHPAVLKMIRMTVEAGHRHNIPVGICGELASDLSLTETFLRLGVDELSVNPQGILRLRQHIRSLDLSKDK